MSHLLLKRSMSVCVILYLVEASDQALRLLHHASLYPPLHHALDVFLLVLLRDGDVGSAWLQLPLCYLQKHTQDNKYTHQTLERFTVAMKWRKRRQTCPKTSSLTVNVRSSMSSMSLSFIHCSDWWNSSSRYSRSLRSHGLQRGKTESVE